MVNTKENIHVWRNTRGAYMISNETTKRLVSIDLKDNAINYLFINGFRATAKQLHETKL